GRRGALQPVRVAPGGPAAGAGGAGDGGDRPVRGGGPAGGPLGGQGGGPPGGGDRGDQDQPALVPEGRAGGPRGAPAGGGHRGRAGRGEPAGERLLLRPGGVHLGLGAAAALGPRPAAGGVLRGLQRRDRGDGGHGGQVHRRRDHGLLGGAA